MRTNRDKEMAKYAKKLAFSKFVDSKKTTSGVHHQEKGNDTDSWLCCDTVFGQLPAFHKHVAYQHSEDIDKETSSILTNGSTDAHWSILKKVSGESTTAATGQKSSADGDNTGSTQVIFRVDDVYPWLPDKNASKTEECNPTRNKGQVILFYHYRAIENMEHVKNWQLQLCKRLQLTGKVRIATEGINGTVAGSVITTELYIQAVLMHPLFSDMTPEDFKRSSGDHSVFHDGLKVGVYEELVPMGLSSNQAPYTEAGDHLSPEEFHGAIEKHLHGQQKDSVFVDCRNFYESRIGRFEGALDPNIRKFSYWPEYVDKNLDLFRDKSVFMYCTGGIRCERGSAYLKQKGVCKNVYQLHGGIHKYIEAFPEGHYRGKLFVFDDRYAIKANEDIVSECVYCKTPWDQYKLCSSTHCCQLVLACASCQAKGLTACCTICQQTCEAGLQKEECQCTQNRPRVPAMPKEQF